MFWLNEDYKMKNILLIDDDTTNNFIMGRYLDRLKLSNPARIALNGQQGIELLTENILTKREMPDLILLDIQMPIMDGFGFLEAFKNLSFPGKENIRIVVVSSSNYASDVQKAKDLGAVDCLMKPVSEEILTTILLLTPGMVNPFSANSV
jgi:CheY-like chemotaxis protein